MNPTFFPYTWIPEPDRTMLFACFKQVVICQPARELTSEPLLRLERDGRLDIRLPNEEIAKDLPELLKAHHSWAELHRGEAPDFYKFAALRPPDPDDVSTFLLRSKIRNPEGENPDCRRPPVGRPADLLQRATLFLAIAQEYDQQEESLSRELHHIDTMEKNLLQNLSPDRESPEFIQATPPSSKEAGTAGPMPARRLTAWCRLYAHCRQRGGAPQPPPLPLFVTSSQEAFELMLTPMDMPEVVCRIENIPLVEGQKSLAGASVHQEITEKLLSAARGEPCSAPSTISLPGKKSRSGGSGSMVVCRVAGDPVAAHLAGPDNSADPAGTIRSDGEKPYSLVGHIQGKLHA